MSERRNNRDRDNGRGGHGNPRQQTPLVPPPEKAPAALPAPGTATAVASGAAGPARPVLPYDRPGLAERRNEGLEETNDGDNRRGDGGGDGRSQRSQQQGHGEDVPHDLKKPGAFSVTVVLAGLAVLLAILFAVGLLPRLKRNRELNADAKQVEEAPPTVNAARPRRAQAVTDLVLPGNVLAWQDTGIYARITGYVKEWHHDLGDYVKAGELLAVIEAPDVDQQLEQAKAQLGQSKASLQRAQADVALQDVTLRRFEELFKIKAVNEQQLDQTRAAAASAHSTLDQTTATIARDEANVRQFTEEQSWERVTAPFDGKITARNVDVGQLIMPGTTASNTGGGKEMFHIAGSDVVRVMIAVPQTFVAWIQPGQPAEVFFRDNPKHGIAGKVTRFSGALDPTSRTLLTEVDVPNTQSERPLTPGFYLQVKFSVKRNDPPLMVPESALIYNAQGTQLALVRQDGGKSVVHFQPIVMGRDTGTEIEAISGLEPGDLVVTNPGERLVDGGPVKLGDVAAAPQGDQKQQGPGELGTPGATPTVPSISSGAPPSEGAGDPTAATTRPRQGILIPPMTMPPGKAERPLTLPATEPAVAPTPPAERAPS